jgi:serine/threonine-protein kinase
VDLCLKIIAPTFDMGRLQREIAALQSVAHPNVVVLREYTFSTAPGRQRHYLIEDFVDGNDLTQEIGNAWPLDRASRFFAMLADGLAALGRVGVVHRDLKPSNIRVRPDGSPVIIDFGLARHLGLSDLTHTSEGAAFGTPMYFAPEQFTGTKREIDHRTDLFAFGVLLFQAVVGHHPFINPGVLTLSDLRNSVCNSTDYLNDPGFSALPAKWRLLIARLLEKERGGRPQSAEQVALILRKLESEA